MPFSTRKGSFLLYSVFATAVVVAIWFWQNYETRERASHDMLMQVLTVILLVAWLLMMAVITVRCASKLYVLPEGITVTLFGRTLRRFPAGQIKLLAGFRENTVKAASMSIAVCSKTLEEFQEWGKCCGYEEPWEGEQIIKYISRIPSIVCDLNLHSKILLLDWSPERLGILQEMYPDVQWLDCTQKKLFEEQLKNQ